MNRRRIRAAIVTGALLVAAHTGLSVASYAQGAPVTKGAIVFVPGGAWRGYATDYTAEAAQARKAGYATTIVRYRLGNIARAQRDVASAISATRTRLPKRLRARVAVVGDSAGGQLALMNARRANAVVAISAPTDLRTWDYDGGIEGWSLLADVGANTPRRRAAASPVLHATDRPTLLIYQAGDPLVPISEGRRMRAASPRATLRALPGRGHALIGIPDQTPIILTYLQRHWR